MFIPNSGGYGHGKQEATAERSRKGSQQAKASSSRQFVEALEVPDGPYAWDGTQGRRAVAQVGARDDSSGEKIRATSFAASVELPVDPNKSSEEMEA